MDRDNTVQEKPPGINVDPVEQDGIRVHPQPTSDPLDPLNWSRLQKNGILGIVMFKYFLFTYLTTTTVPSFPEIQSQFGISYSQVNWTVAIPALGLSVGPLVWSSLSDVYGRRIVFLVGTLIALVATIGAAVADGYAGYMAARFFQGFGVAPASSVGMAVVNDLFFDYERGEKLGLWVLAIDSGLLLGPTFGGFLNLVSAAWINWFNAILFGALLVLEIFFMPETLYPRTLMLARMPKVPRTKSLPLFNTAPIPGLSHAPLYTTLTRFVSTFTLPIIPLAVLGYSFLWYWWVLSVITMIPAAYPTYTPLIQGLLFLGLFLGTILSEVFCSGRLSDAIVRRLAKRNGGVRVAEMRLPLAFPAIVLTGVGLVVWGVSVQRNWHWVTGQVGLFLFGAGIQVGNTVTSSYIIDSYPLQSTAVVIFYAVFLNLSAFVNPFFISPWQASAGWTWTFTAQALIVFVAGTALFAGLWKFGARLRARGGMPGWVNPEFDSA
ncbi:major facilitator superfamily domain-containing protein [Aspergillus pseudodeflectus]|uniref:Major facilitator superfamily domain-containing protein n=1 Tax=Aspergillus pseudodeflectus TaxID=176178 RepID=A0ABR4KCP4_9EURO